MVAPSFSTAGTLASANAASISPGLPAGWAVGDFWFLAVASDGGTLSLSAGWDQYALSSNVVSGQGTQTILFATRVAQSGDVAPTISGANNSIVGRIWKIVNANTADPFDGDAQFVKPTTLSADIATPSIVISGEDRLVVIGVAWRDDIGTAVLNSGTPTFSSLFEIETLSGTDAGMVAYSHASTGASTIAARSVNITGTGPALAQGFAIAFNPSGYSSVTGVSVASEPAGEADVIITTSDDAIVRIFYDTVSRPTDTNGSLYANESAWEPISEVVEAGPFLITLTGLTEGQTYYYKVESKNAANNSWYTAESSFRYDTAGPVISGIGTTPLARSVTITWTTDEAASSQVKYDTTSHAGANDTYAVTRAELDTVTRVTNHSYNVTGLAPTTTYYYRVRGADSSGNDSGWSAENSFTTLADALIPGALLLDANFRTLSVRAPFSMTGGSTAGYTAVAEYKRTSESTWRQAPEMRVDTRATLGYSSNGANWAVNEARCKIFRVQPNITYDVRVTWSGGVIQGSATITGQTTTLPETTPTPTNRILYVAQTGNDLNNGLTFATAKATLKGAFDIAQAGDDIQIQPGAYSITTANLPVLSVDGNGSGAWGSGWIRVRKRPGQAGDVILEGNGVNNHVIQILGSYVAVTDITMRIALQSVVYIGGTQKSYRWIENCTISDWGEGTTGSEQHFAGIAMWLNPERSFILNNTLTRRVILAGQQNAMGHGIWLKNQMGDGEWGGRHIIRGNTIVGGYDCIGAEAENDRHGGPRLNSDTYLNTCSGYVDDAIQMEGANINCAVFDNIIDCAGGIVGIATAPSGIGPIYIMYNQINNPGSYAFKLGDQGDGFQHWYHNTVYEASSGGNAGGGPGQTNGGLSNIISRNNIFQADRYTMETTTAATSGVGIRDFDYDNLHTTDPARFIKWWNTTYSSLAALRTATSQELHGFSINAANEWQNPAAKDFRLKPTSSFIDAGQIIPGINSDLDDATYNYIGSAPNLGAIEGLLPTLAAEVSSVNASLPSGSFIGVSESFTTRYDWDNPVNGTQNWAKDGGDGTFTPVRATPGLNSTAGRLLLSVTGLSTGTSQQVQVFENTAYSVPLTGNTLRVRAKLEAGQAGVWTARLWWQILPSPWTIYYSDFVTFTNVGDEHVIELTATGPDYPTAGGLAVTSVQFMTTGTSQTTATFSIDEYQQGSLSSGTTGTLSAVVNAGTASAANSILSGYAGTMFSAVRMPATADFVRDGQTLPALPYMPVVSRFAHAYTSSGSSTGDYDPHRANDNEYNKAWRSVIVPSGGTPQWLAYHLGGLTTAQRERLIVHWRNDHVTYDYWDNGANASYLQPEAYLLQGNTTAPEAMVAKSIQRLSMFTNWLAENNVQGILGEMGWPNNEATDKWNGVAQAVYERARLLNLPVQAWSAGRWWGTGYKLAVYTSTSGDLNTAGTQAPVVEYNVQNHELNGINVNGAEFGTGQFSNGTYFSNTNRGIYGTDYTYPSANDWLYLAGRGIQSARLAVRWERLQPTLGAALNTTELERLTTTIFDAEAAGIGVILCVYGFGDYYTQGTTINVEPNYNQITINSGTVKSIHFADLWGRLSTAFSGNNGVIAYDLMNEPRGFAPETYLSTSYSGYEVWEYISQAAVDAIRGNADNTLILVPGSEYSSTIAWNTVHPDPWITDPINNYRYEAHLYLDDDHSGAYTFSYASQVLDAADDGYGLSTVPSSGWTTLATITGNEYNSRQHDLGDCSTYNWLRMSVSVSHGEVANDDVGIQLDIHSATETTEDNILALGDSITAAIWKANIPGGGAWTGGNIAQRVHRESGRFPLMQNGGTGGKTVTWAITNRVALLAGFTGEYVVLGYGTNDASGSVDASDFESTLAVLRSYITVTLGKTVILPRLLKRTDSGTINGFIQDYNDIIDGMVNGTTVLAGPDFYTAVDTGAITLSDGIHPTNAGAEVAQQMWADWFEETLYTETPTTGVIISGDAVTRLFAEAQAVVAGINNAPWLTGAVLAALTNVSLATSFNSTIISRIASTLGAEPLLATGRSYDPTWKYPIIVPVNTVLANAGLRDAIMHQPVLANMVAQAMTVTSVVSSVAGMHGRVLYVIGNVLSAVAASNSGYIGQPGSVAFNTTVATALSELPVATFDADITVYLGGFISFRDSSMVDTLTSLQMGYTTMKWGVADVIDTLASFPTMHKRS